MDNMNKEICEYFSPKSHKDKLCKYYNGDTNKVYQLERCRQHCNIMESTECMKERSYKRIKGALRQK